MPHRSRPGDHCLEQATIEATGGPVIDILDRSLVAQPGVVQSRPQSPFIALVALRSSKSPSHSACARLPDHLNIRGFRDYYWGDLTLLPIRLLDQMQLALPWLWVEPVLEDRWDRAVRAGADVETAIAGVRMGVKMRSDDAIWGNLFRYRDRIIRCG